VLWVSLRGSLLADSLPPTTKGLSPMRRALVSLATFALIGSTVAAAPAMAANPLPDVQFGMHVPAIANGERPNANIGAVRLWDSGVAWGQVQQKKNLFWWNGMDAAIASANAQNMQITYVLGSTPKWAQKKAPKGNYPYGGTGSANPKMSDWKKWVRAVVQRYGNSIDAYQIWNEANLADFYTGSPKQMAQLTREAAKIIRAGDPTAKVVAASSTVRLEKAYKRFFPAYLKELRKMGWPVDAISVHSYPDGKGTPGDRLKLIDQVLVDVRKAKVPDRIELWDTEVNYGIKGPGKIKGQKISGGQAADWTASTFLDSVMTGIDRTYWYYWYKPDGRLGIILQDGTTGAVGYQTAYDWMVGSFYSCTRGNASTPNVCQLGDAVDPEVVVWSNEGVGTYTVPAGATVQCNTLSQCSAIAPGTQLPIGGSPLWFGSQANYEQLLAKQQVNAAERAGVQAAP
jgi:hypothetical protein